MNMGTGAGTSMGAGASMNMRAGAGMSAGAGANMNMSMGANAVSNMSQPTVEKANFIKKNPNGTVSIQCNNIPDYGFIDVVKVRDICKMRMLTRAEKKLNVHGSPDVVMQSITGEQYRISRIQLITNFGLLSGGKIILASMHSDKIYTVSRVCMEPYKALQLPNNYIGLLNGVEVPKGSYIVCKVLADGNIDRANAFPISSEVFHKVFKVPMQEAIAKHRNHSKNTQQPIPEQFNKKPTVSISKQPSQPIPKQAPVALQKPAVQQPVRPTQNRAVSANINHEPINKQHEYRYRLTQRILDQDRNLVGFVVLDKKTGRTQNTSIKQVLDMCDAKVIENATAVTKDGGIKYLRGKGIELRSLPPALRQ